MEVQKMIALVVNLQIIELIMILAMLVLAMTVSMIKG